MPALGLIGLGLISTSLLFIANQCCEVRNSHPKRVQEFRQSSSDGRRLLAQSRNDRLRIC